MLSLREAFVLPQPAEAIELRAFTHGLMPKTVPQMMAHFVDDWKSRGVDAWNAIPNHWLPGTSDRVSWWSLPEYLGDHFIAPLLEAPVGTCILQPNVHWIMQCLLSSREVFGKKKEVVLTKAEFPSVIYSVQQWADLQNYSLRLIPVTTAGFVDQEAVLRAIGPKTAMVILSHVGFLSGEKLPDAFLTEVAEAVHRHGGLFVLDGYHATGSIPVNVQQYNVDVYLGGLLKEACGSTGNAYVYIRPGLELTPRLTGWFGDAHPFAFAPFPEPHEVVRRRFMGGTTAVASFYHAVEGVRLLLEVGLASVRDHSLRLTEVCITRAEAASLPLYSPREADRRSAMVIFEVPAADKLCSYLKTFHVYTDSRKGKYLRLAPFVWNTEEEIARTFDLLEEAVTSRRYLTDEDAMPQIEGPVT